MGLTGKQTEPIDPTLIAEGYGGIPFFFFKHVTGSTTAWTVVAQAEFRFKVIGVKCVCTASKANGTVRVDNGSNAITSAITMDTDTECTGTENGDGAGAPATIDDTYWVIEKGGSLKLTTANSADGDVYIMCVKDEE